MDIYLILVIVAFVLGLFAMFAVMIPTMIHIRVEERERLDAEVQQVSQEELADQQSD